MVARRSTARVHGSGGGPAAEAVHQGCCRRSRTVRTGQVSRSELRDGLEWRRPIHCQHTYWNDDWQRCLAQRMPNGDAERLPFNTPFNETDGKLSTDSRWIAYVTDGSGDDDVWIASFPAGETRRQVSTRGGKSPQWGANEREIFYVSREKELMSVSFRAEGGNVNIGTPRPLFHVPRVERGGSAGPGPAHALGVSGAAPAGAPLHGG